MIITAVIESITFRVLFEKCMSIIINGFKAVEIHSEKLAAPKVFALVNTLG